MTQKIDFVNRSSEEEKILEKVNQIGGHLLDTEIIALYRFAGNLPPNANILEIGSYRGKSSNAIGHAINGSDKTLYCLDIWKDYENQPTGPLQTDKLNYQIQKSDISVLTDFLKNTDWFNNNLRILKGSTTEFAEFLPKKFFDMIFIDGAHDYENVCNDIAISLPLLKSEGILAGHDYHSAGVGVMQAVEDKILTHPKLKECTVLDKTSIWVAVIE